MSTSISAFWNRPLPESSADYQPLESTDLEAASNGPSFKLSHPNSEKSHTPDLSHQQPDELPQVGAASSQNRAPRPIILSCVIGSFLFLLVLIWRPQSSLATPGLSANQPNQAALRIKVSSSYPNTSIPPVLLHWEEEPHRPDPPIDSCIVRVHFTPNRSAAEGVIWPQQMPEPAPKGVKQKNAFWALENAVYYPVISEARESIRKGEGILDYEMTYRLSSHVPLPYDYGFIDLRLPAKPFSERRQDKLIAAFISNCYPKNDRMKVLEKMMHLLPGQIDSFGHCLRTASSDKELEILAAQPGAGFNVSKLSNWERKMTLIKNYKFTIAFENADEEDYVTEKYYQALAAGSIPLHLGQAAHAFDKFLPAPGSAINVRDYDTTEDLVKELRSIAANETRFNTMISWKDKPFLPFFQQIVDWGKDSDVCRLAKLMRGVWSNPYAHPATPIKPQNSRN